MPWNSFTPFEGYRDKALQKLASIIKGRIKDDSPIKNIKTSGKYTTYWIEIKEAISRGNAYESACNILKDNNITGEYSDSRWSKFHQDIYKVTIKKKL